MGEVHLAKREGPGGFVKPVVIKRILRYLAQEPEQVRHFLAEARLAALIDHPNVVQVFELAEDQDGYFIVMEYVHGQTLRGVLRELKMAGGQMPPLIAARIIADALRGLHAAHGLVVRGKAHPIVHRDVSPENILVSFAGVTKVTDFGLAKSLDADSHTRPGLLKGKYAYLAPEVIGGQRADLRVDVYAAGTVLFELLTGAPPFAGDSSGKVLHDIVSTPPPDVCQLSPSCPSELGAIVRRALVKDPNQRFATAGDMCAALETFLFSAPLQVGSDKISSWMTERFGQAEANRDVLTESGAAVQHTVATLAASPRGTRRPPDKAGPPLARSLRVLWPAGAAAVLMLAAAGALLFSAEGRAPAAAPDPEVRSVAAAQSPQAITSPIAAAPTLPSAPEAAAPDESLPRDAPRVRTQTPATPNKPPPGRRTPKPARGQVKLQVRPWAEVFLDGRSLGVTPLLEPVDVRAGRVVFVLKNKDLGVSRSVTVEVPPGKTVVLRENLLAR